MRYAKRWAAPVLSLLLALCLATGALAAGAGDLTGDGKVNAKDVVSLQRALAGGYGLVPPSANEADLNLDGKVNGKDVVVLQRYLAGGYGVALPGGSLTRADLEQAIAETAFAFSHKDGAYEYDNENLSVVGRSYGGSTRVSHLPQPEDVTSEEHRYGVCTAYVFHVYYAALGHKLFGLDNENEFLTDRVWRIIENQADVPYWSDDPDPVTENDIDQCILRWKSSDYTFDKTDRHFGVDKSPYFANFGDTHLEFANGYYPETAEEQEAADGAVQAFLSDWQNNLRPGDIFLVSGHAMLYVGNDCVLDCATPGGGKYNPTTGFEAEEPVGSTGRMHSVECYYLEGGYPNYWFDDAGTLERAAVIRPLDALVAPDGDDDPGNDPVKDRKYTLPAGSAERTDYPGIEIDRTVDAGAYGTAVSGGTLTYRVKITNRSDEPRYAAFRLAGDPALTPAAYQGLTVTERIPAGTEFVSASGGIAPESGVLRWSLDVPAGGEETVSYTVRVTAPMGQRIVCSGGTVGGIPSNTISNAVGGAKLGQTQQAVLTAIADTDPADWPERFGLSGQTCDMDFASRIYQNMGVSLELPALAELTSRLFVYRTTDRPSIDFAAKDALPIYAFMPRQSTDQVGQAERAMLVDRYVGGYRYYAGPDTLDRDINYFDASYLEPGDILVYVSAAADAVPTEHGIMVRADDSAGRPVLLAVSSDGSTERFVGREVNVQQWRALRKAIRLFFVLRPSQAIADVNASVYTGPALSCDGPVPAGRPLKLGTTALSDDAVARLKALTFRDVVARRCEYLFRVYEAIGVPGLNTVWVNDSGSMFYSEISTLTNNFLRTDTLTGPPGNDLDRTYLPTRAPSSYPGFMLLDGFWGGTWVQGGRPVSELSWDELQPGDAILLGDRAVSSVTGNKGNHETCAVYQGDGKFLVGAYFWMAVKDGTNGLVRSGDKYGTLDFSGAVPTGEFNVDGSASGLGSIYRTVNDLAAGDDSAGVVRVDSFADFLTVCPFTGKPWDFFLAVRPAQGVYDLYDLSYAPNW